MDCPFWSISSTYAIFLYTDEIMQVRVRVETFFMLTKFHKPKRKRLLRIVQLKTPLLSPSVLFSITQSMTRLMNLSQKKKEPKMMMMMMMSLINQNLMKAPLMKSQR